MANLNLHNVKKVTLGDRINLRSEAGPFVMRTISIETGEGTFTIDLISNDEESLEISLEVKI